MKRIVVGTDGSAGAANAMRWAARLASRHGAELVVMTGLVPTDSELPPKRVQALLGERERELAAWSEAARLGDVAVRTVVERGDPRPGILAVAERERADLIVVGRVGRSAGPGLLHFGSVAEWLAHHSDLPVAVVGGAVNLVTRRVLVGVDGSDGSLAAVRWVREMRGDADVRVVAASVEQPYLEWTPADSSESWRRTLEDKIRDEYVAELVGAGVDVDVLALAGSNAADQLLQGAEDERVDLVVVGTRGLGGFSGLRIGGVALKVLHRADRPVVFVPSRLNAGGGRGRAQGSERPGSWRVDPVSRRQLSSAWLGSGWLAPVRGGLWVMAALYTMVALAPLFVILAGQQSAARGFWLEFGVALGFIGLAMLCLQSVLTARYPRVSGAVGQDTMLQFHRQTGLVAFGFVSAHPVVLLVADPDYWAFLDPRVSFLRAVFLIFVVIALPVLIVTSLWRESFHLPYQWWRVGHGALALMILVVGLVHITRVRHYLADPWKQVVWVAMGTASIGSILYVRAIKPLRVRRHPYRLVDVSPAASRTWTLTLEPESGQALEFRAGQFAFVTLADTPFSLEQHPFTIASSAERRDRLEFAVKELGDYTNTIGATPVGQVGFVDGPYGSLHLPPDSTAGLVMVAGGIGISPVMSMLRTLRDRCHDAPVLVIYAADRIDDVAYDAELDDLARHLPLRFVRVLRDPPEGWDGERGLVDAALLDRHLPSDESETWQVVLCGPPPMMDVVERALRDRGVPLEQIHSERFDIGAAGAVGQRSIQVRRLVMGLGLVMVAAAVLFAL